MGANGWVDAPSRRGGAPDVAAEPSLELLVEVLDHFETGDVVFGVCLSDADDGSAGKRVPERNARERGHHPELVEIPRHFWRGGGEPRLTLGCRLHDLVPG